MRRELEQVFRRQHWREEERRQGLVIEAFAGAEGGREGATLASLGASGWALFHGWSVTRVILPMPSVTALLTLCCGLGWVLGVRPEAVRIPADRYGRYLLEAALDLEPQ